MIAGGTSTPLRFSPSSVFPSRRAYRQPRPRRRQRHQSPHLCLHRRSLPASCPAPPYSRWPPRLLYETTTRRSVQLDPSRLVRDHLGKPALLVRAPTRRERSFALLCELAPHALRQNCPFRALRRRPQPPACPPSPRSDHPPGSYHWIRDRSDARPASFRLVTRPSSR